MFFFLCPRERLFVLKIKCCNWATSTQTFACDLKCWILSWIKYFCWDFQTHPWKSCWCLIKTREICWWWMKTRGISSLLFQGFHRTGRFRRKPRQVVAAMSEIWYFWSRIFGVTNSDYMRHASHVRQFPVWKIMFEATFFIYWTIQVYLG